MNETETHICTECLFIGEPHLSLGRLFIEFFANLLTGVGGVPLFQKVRHCPKCGSHSMVPIESEAGNAAITRLNEEGQDRPKPTDSGGATASPKFEEDIIRSHLQR